MMRPLANAQCDRPAGENTGCLSGVWQAGLHCPD